MRMLAVIGGLGVASLAAASAAQVDAAADDLGAGVSVVGSCDTDGVDITFTELAYDLLLPGGPPGMAVMQVNVDDIAFPACEDQRLTVALIDGADEQLAATAAVEISGSSATAALVRPVPTGTCAPGDDTCPGASAEAVEEVAVVITGSTPSP